MQIPNDGTPPLASTTATDELAHQPRSDLGKKRELVELLLKRTVPEKDEIIRTKNLIRELAQQPDIERPAPGEVKDFLAAYLDLYVGRITADRAIESSALRRCLDHLGAPDAGGWKRGAVGAP